MSCKVISGLPASDLSVDGGPPAKTAHGMNARYVLAQRPVMAQYLMGASISRACWLASHAGRLVMYPVRASATAVYERLNYGACAWTCTDCKSCRAA
jgi:hypothetical protein